MGGDENRSGGDDDGVGEPEALVVKVVVMIEEVGVVYHAVAAGTCRESRGIPPSPPPTATKGELPGPPNNVYHRNGGGALWSGTNKNRDVSTGPHARPFVHLLAPLTRSLPANCLLPNPNSPLRSLVRSLAHPLARGKVNF